MNYFQPSSKLQTKERDGGKLRRTHDRPLTPCDRLLKHPAIGENEKADLRRQRERLDPLELLHRIREGQAALAALNAEENAVTELGRRSLEQFLSQLPRLWRAGEVRPTHRKKPTKPRYWRTRKDPFETVWPEVLEWLQQEPESTAKALLCRLQQMCPGDYADGQLRTLQRRVREWRHVMAKRLVYACLEDEEESPEAVVVGDGAEPDQQQPVGQCQPV